MGVGLVELSLRDVLSVPATLALFLRPISLDPESRLLSASDNLFVFNLSVWSGDTESFPWPMRGFFVAVDLRDGLVDRASRRFGGERFVSGDEISIGSSEVEDLGLGVPDLPPWGLDVFNLLWTTLIFPFPEGEVGDDNVSSFPIRGEVLLFVCFLGGVGEGLTCLFSLPFAATFIFEESFSGFSGSGLRVLPKDSFEGELADAGFLGELLEGDAGRLRDLVFTDSKVSHSVARYVTIDFSSGFSTLTSIKQTNQKTWTQSSKSIMFTPKTRTILKLVSNSKRNN